MAWLGRVFSAGSRFIGKVAPVASYIGRVAPSALNAVSRFSSDPTVNAIANRIGINPNVLRNVGQGASNVGAGLSLIPGVANDLRGAAAGAAQGYQSAVQATNPARQSLAQLYNTATGR